MKNTRTEKKGSEAGAEKKAITAQALLAALTPKGFKEMLEKATRKDLDRYAFDIIGLTPHKTHSDEKVREHLGRWADGDKNWTADPRPPGGDGLHRTLESNPDAHTKREGEMTKNGNGKVAAKNPAEKKAEKVAEKAAVKKAEKKAAKKVAAPKEEKEKVPELAILGKKMPSILYGKDGVTAKVAEDGTIIVGKEKFHSPSAAWAKTFNAAPGRNGWIAWKVKGKDGTLTPLGDLRTA